MSERHELAANLEWIRSINWYKVPQGSEEFLRLKKIYGRIPSLTLTEIAAIAESVGVILTGLAFARMFGGQNRTMDYVPSKTLPTGETLWLLSKRAEAPFNGMYFFLGGRGRPAQSNSEALATNFSRELGKSLFDQIAPERIVPVGEYTLLNPEGADCPMPYFTQPTMNTVHMRPEELEMIEQDATSKGHRWFSSILARSPWQLEVGLRMVGMKKRGE